jgi:2-isopropylmalate synthase
MKKINVTDVTLKNLSEDREVSLLFREKSAIANCADRLGADAVELPALKNIREDSIIYKTIAKNVQNAILAIPVGFSPEGVEAAWECIKEAKAPRLQVELPVSTIQMEYTYHVKQSKMLEKIGELIAKSREYTADVEFSALDATRADEDFLIEAVKAAEEKGANLITVCDNAGTSTPEEIAKIVNKVKSAVSVPVYVQVCDRINMAVASAFSAIAVGADGLKSAMVGKNILLTSELSDAINACGAKIGAEVRLNSTNIHSKIEDIVASINHADYENMGSVSEKKKILLDSATTLSQAADAASLLGYELSEADIGSVYKALMQVCEKKGAVGAKEFEALIASSAMQAPSTYHFESYTTTSSNISSAMTQIILKKKDEIISGVSSGDGPIDSAFRAIEQCIGHHYELDDYQVQSVTEGKEALGSALVRLRAGGKLYSGNGTSTDIIAASIRAYINALNKIVFEEA